MALLTVDWEDWHDALHIDGESLIREPTMFLFEILAKYDVKATFYILGKTAQREPWIYDELFNHGHTARSHGYYHYPYEDADRKPYANMGMTGGFYFRALPYWLIKREVERNGQLYVHPHDLMLYHPKLSNPILNWKRHIGLSSARHKLDRLLQEVHFDDPRQET